MPTYVSGKENKTSELSVTKMFQLERFKLKRSMYKPKNCSCNILVGDTSFIYCQQVAYLGTIPASIKISDSLYTEFKNCWIGLLMFMQR